MGWDARDARASRPQPNGGDEDGHQARCLDVAQPFPQRTQAASRGERWFSSIVRVPDCREKGWYDGEPWSMRGLAGKGYPDAAAASFTFQTSHAARLRTRAPARVPSARLLAASRDSQPNPEGGRPLGALLTALDADERQFDLQRQM